MRRRKSTTATTLTPTTLRALRLSPRRPLLPPLLPPRLLPTLLPLLDRVSRSDLTATLSRRRGSLLRSELEPPLRAVELPRWVFSPPSPSSQS